MKFIKNRSIIYNTILIVLTLFLVIRAIIINLYKDNDYVAKEPVKRIKTSLIEQNVYSEKIAYSTYHKYIMIDNGKDLIHLRSCKNPTHKKLIKNVKNVYTKR